MDREKQFEKWVPMKSCLGREFLALQVLRDEERRRFESEKDKMGADTLAYRRSEIALDISLNKINNISW